MVGRQDDYIILTGVVNIVQETLYGQVNHFNTAVMVSDVRLRVSLVYNILRALFAECAHKGTSFRNVIIVVGWAWGGFCVFRDRVHHFSGDLQGVVARAKACGWRTGDGMGRLKLQRKNFRGFA